MPFETASAGPLVSIRRDQLRRRPRAEAEIIRCVVGREELHDAQAVLAVGEVGESAGAGHAELHVARVVDLAAAR